MRDAGKIVAECFLELAGHVRPGVSTGELDRIAAREIKKRKAVASFLGYRGFPASLCTSVGQNVVHGIPTDDEILKEGEIVSLDLGVLYNGYHGDSAITLPVGTVSRATRRLLEVTRQSLFVAILKARPGNRLHDISAAVQSYAESHDFAVVREYTGHGIGKDLHEEPSIPNYGKAGTGLRLQEGMVVALEPMINAGTWKTKVQANQWTVSTRDGALSAHFEHTIAITADGPRVLTAL